MLSPGFWSAVVLCLCYWAAGARHWGWGLSAWASEREKSAEKHKHCSRNRWKNMQMTTRERMPLISVNFIRFVRSIFASLSSNFYLCTVGCYGDCEVTKMFIMSCIQILPCVGCASEISPIHHRCNKFNIGATRNLCLHNSSKQKDQIIWALEVCRQREALTSDLPTQSYS